MIFQIWRHSYVKRVPHWLPIILIILSNDVHLNPGPQFQNKVFNFMPWNVDSLAKEINGFVLLKLTISFLIMT